MRQSLQEGFSASAGLRTSLNHISQQQAASFDPRTPCSTAAVSEFSSDVGEGQQCAPA